MATQEELLQETTQQKDLAIEARDATISARNETLSAHSTVLTKADEVATNANTASASASNAASSELKASQWADYPRDQIVPGESNYSARHWAEAAEEAATGIVGDIIFLGPWDAAVDGTPPTPSQGVRYLVTSAGVVDGKSVESGDYIVYDLAGGAWIVNEKGNGVTAVNGHLGNVTLDYGDFAGAQAITIENGVSVRGKETGGTARGLVSLGADNNQYTGSITNGHYLRGSFLKYVDGLSNVYDLIHTGGGQTVTGGDFKVNSTIFAGQFYSDDLTSGNKQVINPQTDRIYVGNPGTSLKLESDVAPTVKIGSVEVGDVVHTGGAQTKAGNFTISGGGLGIYHDAAGALVRGSTTGTDVWVGNAGNQTDIVSSVVPRWNDGTTQLALLHTGGGQTLDGSLTINHSTTDSLVINKTSDTEYSGMQYQVAGKANWLIYTTNDGSGDLSIQARDYTTDGGYKSTLMVWDWSANVVRFNTMPEIAGDPLMSTGGATMTGDLYLDTRLRTDEIRCRTDQGMWITAGESYSHINSANTGNNEFVYVGAESGLKVYSTPDNWGSGFAGRYEASICNGAGDSSFPGDVTAGGTIKSVVTTDIPAAIFAKQFDYSSGDPVLIVAGDGEDNDIIADFRANAGGSSVDISSAGGSADSIFRILATTVESDNQVILNKTGQALKLDTGGTQASCYIGFYNGNSTSRTAYIGHGSSANSWFYINNDANDDIRLSTNGKNFDFQSDGDLIVPSNMIVTGSYYYTDSSKSVLGHYDTWLRLNPSGNFSSGIYCGGTGVLRHDNAIQVGSGGSTFEANSSNLYYSGSKMEIDAQALIGVTNIYVNDGGGNSGIRFGAYDSVSLENGSSWEIDCANDSTSGDLTFAVDSSISAAGEACSYVSVLTMDGGTKRVTFHGEFTVNSDIRLKKNLKRKPYKPSELRDKLMKIEWLMFDWKEGTKEDFGVIAQEIIKVLPEVVDETYDKYQKKSFYTVNYQRISNYWSVVNQWQEERLQKLEEAVYGKHN